MQALDGKLSDVIRGGLLPADVQVIGPRIEADDRPDPKAVLRAAGYGLGRGAYRFLDFSPP